MSNSQARLGFGIAGAVIGSFFGQPGLGFVIGSSLGGALFPPDPTVIDGPRLNELQNAISEYGAPIPIVYGTVRLGGNYFWATEIVEKVHKQTESGKGGGGGTVTRTYSYFGNFGVQFCEKVDAVLQLYADNKIMADFTVSNSAAIDPRYIADAFVTAFQGSSVDTTAAGGGGSGGFRIHLGGENQVPDFLIEEIEGLGTVSAQRGVTTVVFDDFPLENFGNRIPQISATLCTDCLDNFPVEQMTQWSVSSNGMFFGRDGVSLYDSAQSNFSTVVNSPTRQFIVAPGDVQFENCNGRGSFGPFDADRFGKVATKTENLSSENSINLHDPLTGQALSCSNLGTSEVFTNAVDARFYGRNDNRIFCFGTGVEDDRQTIYGSERILLPDGTIVYSVGFILTYLTSDFGWTQDRVPDEIRIHQGEESAWFMVRHDDGGGLDSLLIRCDHDGVPEDIYDLGILVDNFGYDGATNSWIMYIQSSDTMKRWSIDDTSFDQVNGIDLETGVFTGSTTEPANAFRQGSIGGFMYISSGAPSQDKVTRLNTVTMELEEVYDITGDWGFDAEFLMYDPVLHAMIGGNRWYFLDRGTPDGIPLSEIVSDICIRAGLTAADIDVTALTDSVKGYVLTNKMKARVGIEQLMPLFFFDSVETDHKLKFSKRGTASVSSILDEDLGTAQHGAKNKANKLEKQRAQEIELPQRMELSYIDPDFEYQEGLQASHRAFEVVTTRRQMKLSFPVVMQANEAAQRAEIMLFKPWLERTNYRFTVGPKHFFLDPGDQVTVTADGEIHSIRIMQTQWGANGIYKIEGVGFKGISVAEVDSIYQNSIVLDATTVGGDPDGFVAPTIGELNPTILTVLDAPIARPTDNGFQLYLAAHGLNGTTSWPGAIINRSTDGNNFDPFTFYPGSQQAEVGIANTLLPGTLLGVNATRWTVMDTVSTIEVQFAEYVALASVPLIDLLNGSNLYLIGTEYVSIQTWVDEGDGRWTGSNMLRGRLGTESQLASHALREPVVNMQIGNLFRVEMTSQDLGILYTYQSITFNSPANNPGNLTLAGFVGKSMFPYPPANPTGVKSGADWNFNWIERARHSHKWKDVVDTPTSESGFEDYDIDILSEDLLTVVRTITSTATANGTVVTPSTESAVYDQLDAEADFNGGSPLVDSYGLYRLVCDFYMRNSNTVGRGYKRRVLIEAFPDPIAVDGDYSSVGLLLQANAIEQVADKSKNEHPITVGSALTLVPGGFIESISQYGTGVIQFSNTAESKLTIPRLGLNNALDLEDQDWTMEVWCHQDLEQGGDIISIWDGAGNRQWAFSFTSGGGAPGSLGFIHTVDGTTQLTASAQLSDVFASIPHFGLYHFAIVRDGTGGRFYANGVQVVLNEVAMDFTGGPIFRAGISNAVIGSREEDENEHFLGKLDALRITVGVIRYTGSTYDIPDTRFSNG